MHGDPHVRCQAPSCAKQPFDDEKRNPRAARDVASGKPWVFVEHRTLAEVIATEQQQCNRPVRVALR